MPKITEDRLKYLENFVRSGSVISIARMAKELGIERNSLYIRVKKPFRDWKVGDLEKVAELLDWDLLEMIKIALTYEPKEEVKALPATQTSSKQKSEPQPSE